MRGFSRLAIGLALAVSASFVCAEIKLASLFQDRMVLQRDRAVAFWGWAKPGAKLTLKASWGSVAEAEVDKSGKWVARLNTPKKGGGPYDVVVSGDGQVSLDDVLVGEVWLCSGQSNMEMTVAKGYPPPLKDQEKVIAEAHFPRIRMFNVRRRMSDKPEETCVGEWLECSPKNVGSFSATGYFFAKKLYEELRCPIGMVHASWGGTEVELWTSEGALKSEPELAQNLAKYQQAAVSNRQATEKWLQDLLAADPGNGKWEAPDLSESDWKPISSAATYEELDLRNFDGYVWYRCEFFLMDGLTVGSAKINLGSIDDNDTTYVNGQRIGATDGVGILRSYDIPSNVLKPGRNVVAVRIMDTGGPGGFESKTPEVRINNDLVLSLTNWKFRASTDLSKIAKPNLQPARRFSTLYNGMIAPLVPYTMKGAIWYQGEANVGRAYQYRRSFPNMIRDWRKAWGLGDFPFYFVQIAPFAYGNGMSPELREAQLMTLKEPKTGMAVISDVTGDTKDIHPINKQDVGLRLAYWALRYEYAKHKLTPSGPLYSGMRVEGDKIRIFFDHIDKGLVAGGAELTHFEIAGPDKKFYPAKARIEKENVIVWSEQVPQPVAVRFGWSDEGVPNLFNRALLPASPFRTDDWTGLTINARW